MAERLEVHLPDIGDFHDVDVVELLVAPGERVEEEQSLLVLESDKATMEIPSPAAGVVEELRVRGRRQGERGRPDRGDPRRGRRAAPRSRSRRGGQAAGAPRQPPAPSPRRRRARDQRRRRAASRRAATSRTRRTRPRARPRRTRARRCGGSRASSASTSRACRAPARKGRITREDVQRFVKASLSQGGAPGVPLAGVAVAAPLDDRLREVGRDRAPAAQPRAAALRREPAPQLGDRPPRHAVRRGRHHRARGLPRTQKEEAEAARREAHLPALRGEGGDRARCGSSRTSTRRSTAPARA